MGHVARDRHDGHHSATKPRRSGIGAVVADDHRGATLVGLGGAHRFEVDQPDLTAKHR